MVFAKPPILHYFFIFVFIFFSRISEKGTKKKTKKQQKIKKPIALKPNNGVEKPARSIDKKDSRVFNINDIDIEKIKVSDKKLNEYIPLKITLLDVPGYYNIFNDDGKTMKFKLDDNSLEKVIDIFEHIGEILKIDLDHYLYEDMRGEVYFRTKVSDETYFRRDKEKTTNTIRNEKTKYNCRVLLQMQSVYYINNKGIIKDEDYYSQVLLQHCRYTFFVNNKLIHEALDFTDSEPESGS